MQPDRSHDEPHPSGYSKNCCSRKWLAPRSKRRIESHSRYAFADNLTKPKEADKADKRVPLVSPSAFSTLWTYSVNGLFIFSTDPNPLAG